MNEEAIILHPSRIYLNDRCSLYVKRMYHAHELNLKSGDSHKVMERVRSNAEYKL